MLREMRPSELGEFFALARIDDWTGNRGDLQAGIIASTLAEINRDPKKKSDSFKASDFMPYVQAQSTEKQRNDDLSARLRAALMAAGKAKPKKAKAKK